jgi:hypothetical protein
MSRMRIDALVSEYEVNYTNIGECIAVAFGQHFAQFYARIMYITIFGCDFFCNSRSNSCIPWLAYAGNKYISIKN